MIFHKDEVVEKKKEEEEGRKGRIRRMQTINRDYPETYLEDLP
jgi:hypothetical protein